MCAADVEQDALAPTVTLDVWRLPAATVPRAMVGTLLDSRRLRARADVAFAKVLGTGDASFAPRGADLHRWAVLTVWRSAAAAAASDAAGPGWAAGATSHWQARLAPLASHGRWSGAEPFQVPARAVAATWTGPVLALTRARLRVRRAATFWRAVPPVASALLGVDGLDAAFGVGEAPVGVQGTVSLWRDTAAVQAFAWRTPAHRAVVDRTPVAGWYAEELFARLAVVATSGRLETLGATAGSVVGR